MFLILYKVNLWSCLLELHVGGAMPLHLNQAYRVSAKRGLTIHFAPGWSASCLSKARASNISDNFLKIFTELGVEGIKQEKQVHKVHSFPLSCSLFWLFGSCALFVLRFDPGDGQNTRKINTFLTVSWASLLFSFLLTASPPSPSTPKAPSWQHPYHFKTTQHIRSTYCCLFR